MVVMGVSHRYDVDLADRPAPQVWRDHVLTDVDLWLRFASERESPATVHQHQFSVREGKQQAIALTDIDGRQFQLPTMNVRRERMPKDQYKQNADGAARNPTPTAPGMPDRKRERNQSR